MQKKSLKKESKNLRLFRFRLPPVSPIASNSNRKEKRCLKRSRKRSLRQEKGSQKIKIKMSSPPVFLPFPSSRTPPAATEIKKESKSDPQKRSPAQKKDTQKDAEKDTPSEKKSSKKSKKIFFLSRFHFPTASSESFRSDRRKKKSGKRRQKKKLRRQMRKRKREWEKDRILLPRRSC